MSSRFQQHSMRSKFDASPKISKNCNLIPSRCQMSNLYSCHKSFARLSLNSYCRICSDYSQSAIKVSLSALKTKRRQRIQTVEQRSEQTSVENKKEHSDRDCNWIKYYNILWRRKKKIICMYTDNYRSTCSWLKMRKVDACSHP